MKPDLTFNGLDCWRQAKIFRNNITFMVALLAFKNLFKDISSPKATFKNIMWAVACK